MRALLRRRGTVGFVGVVVVALAVAGATAATSGEDSPTESAKQATSTADVTKQDLVDTTSVDGTLGYGDATALSARASGTLTSLAAEGSIVTSGSRLYAVDARPVVLLTGSVPAYRRMSVGVEGADVQQLEKALKALGYKGFTVDSKYTASTATAVRKWQKSLGVEKTGAVEVGDVVFGPARLRIASHKATVGDQVAPGTAVLETTGTTRLVTVDLDVSQQRLARTGATVDVELPDGSRVSGKVASVGAVAKSSDDGSGQDASSTIDVVVTLAKDAKTGRLDEAPVDVELESQRRTGVLTVPVTALLALAEGGYGVRVVDAAATRIVAVKPGMFADGRVEVSGSGLAAGMKVEVPAS
jgi:peptidoglycan hydrolase-like protein with peptidoglycan-binding domain